MTTYGLNYFKCTTGILEQITLACMALKLSNQQFISGVINEDFVRNSIDWSDTQDVDPSNQRAFLSLKIQLEILAYLRMQLRNAESLDRRVSSYSVNSLDDLDLYREQAYERRSYPISKLNFPEYLTTQNSANLVERRLCFLLLQAIAIQSWIDEWNDLAYEWQARTYCNGSIAPIDNIRELPEINSKKNQLLLELENGIEFRVYESLKREIQDNLSISGEASTAQAEANFFGSFEDPASSGENYMSARLLEQLNNNGRGVPEEPSISNNQKEQPTLSDC